MSRNILGRSTRLLVALMASTMIIPTGVMTRPAAAQEAAVTYDVPAGALGSTLTRVAERSGLQIFYPADLVRGKQSPGVRGAMAPSTALSQALVGSGLTFEYTAGGTVTIVPVGVSGSSVAPADGALVLDTVVIHASGATTEGTGAYTTGQADSAVGLPLSVRETPQSVSVVTSQRLTDQNLGSTNEALSYTTGVNSNTYEMDRVDTTARGFNVGNVIVDGVTLNNIHSTAGAAMQSSSLIYDRIEVVRGATGLLSGAGDPSASVNLKRKQATSTEFEGVAELRYGNWDRIGVGIDLSTPLNAEGTIRGRFIMDAYSGGSFVDRYHINRQTWYATIAADLTPSTQLSFSLEHRNHDPRSSEWGGFESLYADGGRIKHPRSQSSSTHWSYWASRQTVGTAKLEHHFDNGWNAEATLAAAKRSQRSELLNVWGGNLDRETGLGIIPGVWKGDDDYRNLSLDASASGPVDLFGRTHELTFGVRGARQWSRATRYTFDEDLAEFGNYYDWDGNFPRPNWYQTSRSDWSVSTTDYAAYSAAKISIADPLNIIVGARYADWSSDPRSFHSVVPYLGMTWDINQDVSVYASYTEIFNPQDAKDRRGNYLDPVEGKNVELGAKAELLDGRLSGSFAVFRTYQDNVATADGRELVPGTDQQAYYGAKGIESKGVELEIAGEITPGWNVFLGATALNVKDPEGDDVNRHIPRRTVKLFTTYELPGDYEGLTVGGGMRWQSRTWSESWGALSGPAWISNGSWGVVDMMARYDINDQWSAQLNVNNIFDKVYEYRPGNGYGEPRNAMLTLTSRF